MDNYMDNFYSPNLNYIAQQFKKLYNFVDPMMVNKHIVLTTKRAFLDVKDSSVLVVGGGETSINIEKPLLDSYDFIFSMNHFYKHPLLKEYPVDVVMLSPEVDRSEFAQEYLIKFRPLTGFEFTAKHNRESRSINAFYMPEYKFCMHTHIYTKLGYGLRMVIMAAVLKANRVDFIGLDGYRSVKKELHAFEPNKSLRNFNVPHKDPELLCQTQYDEVWKYTNTNFPETKIANIAGDDNPYHRLLEK